jgi:G:T/U-mismatch repair DNA glycosylase
MFDGATKCIVGTLPPPRFTTKALKPGDVDFCYGSRDGQLWPILDRIFDLGLHYETTSKAIEQRKSFLIRRKIAICDIVDTAIRERLDASDLGMQQIELRDILGYLEKYTSIKTLLFTGGNSKNGPEYLFRKQAKENGIALRNVSQTVPRINEFEHPLTRIKISTISLTAPSGAANRAVGSMEAFKTIKAKNPNFTTLDFRVLQYGPYF